MSSQRAKIKRLVGLVGGIVDSQLMFGSVPVTELANQVSTPFYVYSGDAVASQIRRVRDALGLKTEIFYSVKANPSLGLCQIIAQEGAGAEVASIGELLLARRAGFDPEKIIFAGPGKTDEEIRLAARMGIQAVNAESAGEIERISRIAGELDTVVRVGLRVNPSKSLRGAQMRMGGGSQQFGIDEEHVSRIVDQFVRHPRVKITGAHVYAGTQMFDVDTILNNCRNSLCIGEVVADGLEQPLGMLNFGGGFGVPYFENSPAFNLDAFAKGYQSLLAEREDDTRFSGTQFIIELGRYLVSEAGVYVTRVVDVKRSRGKKFIVTDGGMNHHITATGNFGQVFRKPFPVAVVNSVDAPVTESAAVVGPCCTPLDSWGQNIDLPDVAVGDLIGVFYSGAYGFSASSLAFLSHPSPAEVLTWREKVYTIRRHGRPDQVLEGQIGIEG